MTNMHWSEGVVGIVIFATVLAAPVAKSIPHVQPVVLGATLMAAWVAMFVFFHLRYWRYWQRYKKAPESLKKQD